MVDRVHHHAANGRADTQPALRAGLAELLQAVLAVADFTDRGAAVDRDATHLAGAQTQRGVTGFACYQLHRGTGAAGDLRTLARTQLDAMDRAAHRDVAQLQAVARLDRRIATGYQTVVHLHAFRRNDVTTLAVGVAQQRNVRGAVRIVFDALDAGGDAFLVALEIDDAVLLLVTAAAMTHGDAAMMIATAGAGLRLGQRRVRRALVQTFRLDADSVAAARRGRLVVD